MSENELLEKVKTEIVTKWDSTPLQPMDLYNEIVWALDRQDLNADPEAVLSLAYEVLKVLCLSE